MGLRLAGAEVALEFGLKDRRVGVGNVPDFVDGIAGEDDVAVINRGLVEVKGTQLRADRRELLGRLVGEVGNYAIDSGRRAGA